jgi:hypothetical protein
MTDLRTAIGLFSNYQGKLIAITHADGTEWTGMITGLPGQSPASDALAVAFTHIRNVTAFQQDPAGYKGESTLLWPTDVRAIQDL